MQRQAPETMIHPAAGRVVEPPSAGKAAARQGGAPGQDVGGVRPPWGGPDSTGGDGAHRPPMKDADQSDGPGSVRRSGEVGVLNQGPPRTSGALTIWQSTTNANHRVSRETPQKTIKIITFREERGPRPSCRHVEDAGRRKGTRGQPPGVVHGEGAPPGRRDRGGRSVCRTRTSWRPWPSKCTPS